LHHKLQPKLFFKVDSSGRSYSLKYFQVRLSHNNKHKIWSETFVILVRFNIMLFSTCYSSSWYSWSYSFGVYSLS